MLEKESFACDLLPSPIDYAVLRPEGVTRDETLPLLYLLHGGGGSRDYLERVAPLLTRSWEDGTLPHMVVIAPTVSNLAMYLDTSDGSERWQTALAGPLLEHVRARHHASAARHETLLCGPSMGGFGGLCLAFAYPERFGGVAAIAPGVTPALDFEEVALQDRFWLKQESLSHTFGDPVDGAHWRANNPAAIVHDAPQRLRDANLAIYLECGDEDSFGLARGVEFLHRTLFDHQIAHEYRLIRGADHVGATLPDRVLDALRFLGRSMRPPEPDPMVEWLRRQIVTLRGEAGLT